MAIARECTLCVKHRGCTAPSPLKTTRGHGVSDTPSRKKHKETHNNNNNSNSNSNNNNKQQLLGHTA